MLPGDEMAEKIQIMGSTPVEEEPLYGLTYLPRKFKATSLRYFEIIFVIYLSYFFHALAAASVPWMQCATGAPSMNQVAVAIPPSNDVDLFAHCAGQQVDDYGRLRRPLCWLGIVTFHWGIAMNQQV